MLGKLQLSKLFFVEYQDKGYTFGSKLKKTCSVGVVVNDIVVAVVGLMTLKDL